jgi:uncharacterized protein (TIGR02599 family)
MTVRFASPDSRGRAGFSLVELLIATVLVTVILGIVFSVTQQTSVSWSRARSQAESFQTARAAFENMTRTLREATLNTYYDYFDSSGRPASDPQYSGPYRYGRQSELHFVSGPSLVEGQITHAVFFQAPVGYSNDPFYEGMDTLINETGYFIVHDKDRTRPKFLDDLPNPPPNPVRYRLMQFLRPSQDLKVYSAAQPSAWYASAAADGAPVQQLAENTIALILLPRESLIGDSGAPLTGKYAYDTKDPSGRPNAWEQAPQENQRPPVMDVLLVAIDEPSAIRLGDDPLELPGFSDPAALDADLAELEAGLQELRLVYRIFRTAVHLKNSKWTSH